MGQIIADAPEPSEDIKNRFSYHPPTQPGRADAHEKTRALFTEFASLLDAALPPGREHALVITKLEEALMWANAAIARQP